LSRAIASKQSLPIDRLILADAPRRTGDQREASTELTNLRRDENAPREIRDEAFTLSARIASEAFDFAGLERVTQEWLAFAPAQRSAAWSRIYALLRLARPDDAYDVVEQLSLEPETVEQAELLAAVLGEARDLESAARRIAELSDRFDRPERIEAQFLLTALRVQPDERLEDLHQEIRQRLAAFPERFPEFELIRSIAIDSSPEGIDKFFREHIEPGAEHVQRIGQQVRQGEAPIASLAAVVGKPVSLSALQLDQAMPLGFRNPALDGLEQESAAQAVTRAVIWDPVALAVASLPHDVCELVRTAFPASLTPQAAVDDLWSDRLRRGERPALLPRPSAR
jgi:hypothetical protein